jgi:hypothetical protein
MMLVRMDQIQEGVEELLKCKRLNPPPGALQQINDTLRRLEAEGKIEWP